MQMPNNVQQYITIEMLMSKVHIYIVFCRVVGKMYSGFEETSVKIVLLGSYKFSCTRSNKYLPTTYVSSSYCTECKFSVPVQRTAGVLRSEIGLKRNGN